MPAVLPVQMLFTCTLQLFLCSAAWCLTLVDAHVQDVRLVLIGPGHAPCRRFWALWRRWRIMGGERAA